MEQSKIIYLNVSLILVLFPPKNMTHVVSISPMFFALSIISKQAM